MKRERRRDKKKEEGEGEGLEEIDEVARHEDLHEIWEGASGLLEIWKDPSKNFPF